MGRWIACGLLAGIFGTIGTNVSLGQGKAPKGYLFFAHRDREAAAAARAPKAGAPKASAQKARAVPVVPAANVSRPVAEAATSNTVTDSAPIAPATWDSDYDPNYGCDDSIPLPGSSIGYSQYRYAFGKTQGFPLHGYRSHYYWFGHAYCMHCYCGQGECPNHCSGYRGECYTPGWNDGGRMFFENPCGRGSCWDCFWHKGGYERPCRRTDCPNVCQGPPRYSSYGFPQGAAGDPNYVPKGNRDDRIYKMPADIYSIPKPTMVPQNPPTGPAIGSDSANDQAPEEPMEDPRPEPIEEPRPEPQP